MVGCVGNDDCVVVLTDLCKGKVCTEYIVNHGVVGQFLVFDHQAAIIDDFSRGGGVTIYINGVNSIIQHMPGNGFGFFDVNRCLGTATQVIVHGKSVECNCTVFVTGCSSQFGCKCFVQICGEGYAFQNFCFLSIFMTGFVNQFCLGEGEFSFNVFRIENRRLFLGFVYIGNFGGDCAKFINMEENRLCNAGL